MIANSNFDGVTAAPQRRKVPAWAQWMYNAFNYMAFDIGGGPRTLRLDHAINVQKFVTVFFIYGLMNYYDNF